MSMMIRRRYDHLLNDVCADLLCLGEHVEQAFQHATHSLHHDNATTALWVIEHDAQIDELRSNVETTVMGLLATQQPIYGSDLRLLVAVLTIASELERIGDYASSIARRVYHTHTSGTAVNLPNGIERMTELCQQMIHTSIVSFESRDAELARSLAAADDEIDALEDQLQHSLCALIDHDASHFDHVIKMRDVVHALERAADRATNIGERVIFLVTCDVEELNP
jgi:phosphate transport system protein